MLLRYLKTWMLPLAMLTGAFFYDFFEKFSFLTFYLIFSMLFITYCRLSFRELRFSRLHIWLLLIQLAGSMTVYGLLYHVDPLLAEGMFICIFAPTATSAAVVAGMLGGSVAMLAAYTLISSLVVAAMSPVIFSLLGTHSAMPFGDSFLYICRQIIPLLVLPFILALALEKLWPSLHRRLKKMQVISFYLWGIALTIVTGKTVCFILQQDSSRYADEFYLAAGALVVCGTQFLAGRHIGRRYGDAIAGGQGLGQKNTILAIWMAQVYLNPLASIGPAAYVLWQNLINSYQLWQREKGNTRG